MRLWSRASIYTMAQQDLRVRKNTISVGVVRRIPLETFPLDIALQVQRDAGCFRLVGRAGIHLQVHTRLPSLVCERLWGRVCIAGGPYFAKIFPK